MLLRGTERKRKRDKEEVVGVTGATVILTTITKNKRQEIGFPRPPLNHQFIRQPLEALWEALPPLCRVPEHPRRRHDPADPRASRRPDPPHTPAADIT